MEHKPASRIPPGQRVVDRLPVLHVGPIPPFDPHSWTLRLFGRVEREAVFTWEQFTALPTVRVVADVHCVTGWSVLDTVWEGVSPRELLKRVKLLPDARFVVVHCEYGYTTNLPLEAFLDDDVVLAYRYNDAPLAPEHGFPLRLVVPKRYFWKSQNGSGLWNSPLPTGRATGSSGVTTATPIPGGKSDMGKGPGVGRLLACESKIPEELLWN